MQAMRAFLERMLDALFPPSTEALLVRDASYDALAVLVSPVTLPDGTLALLPYRDPLVRAFVKRAKFKGDRKAQHLLGLALAEFLQEHLAERAASGSERYMLQPVPLSARRRRERGYNQAEEIAKVAAQALGLALADSLYRTRDTKAQTSLPKEERGANMEGAFAARTIAKEVTYIVIDDVATTGATMREACKILPAPLAVALAH